MTLARIGRFQVERMLGSGSFATVWLAHDEDLDAWVAIKLLAENWSLNEDARARFMEEAKALRQLDHDRIVRVYEVGRLPDDRPYMVMEYADRGSLEERMRLRAQLSQSFSVPESVALAVDIAECLASVHDLRIVHRDVKPSNILFRSLPEERQLALRREGKPAATERTLLGDFGIARRLERIPGATKVVGSPQYMAPEQADPARARLVDQRGDVYSAAVVLYELLAGRVPQPVDSSDGATVRPIRELRPDVPPKLAEAIARAMARDRDERYATAWDWRSALVEGLRDEPAADAAAAAPSSSGAPPVAADQARAESVRSTAVAATGKQTAVLPRDATAGLTGEGPGIATRPEPGSRRPVEVAGPSLGLRPFSVALTAAGLGLLLALLLPVSSLRTLSGVSATAGGLSVTAAALVAAAALVLLLSGTQLWRARRRWTARATCFAASVAGLIGLAVAGWTATDVLVSSREASPGIGLYVVLVAASIGCLAASAASRRLRPPLATAPVSGR